MKSLSLFVSLLLLTIASAQTSGKGSGIGAKDLRRIHATEMRVLLPTYLPRGYRLASVHIDKPLKKAQMEDSIDLNYTNGRGGKFIIETTSGGIGDFIYTDKKGNDVEITRRQTFQSRILGEVTLEIVDTKSEHQVGTNWIDLGAKKYPRFILLHGTNLPASEAKKVLLSLRYIKKA